LYSPYRKGEYKIRPYEINPTGRNDDQGGIFFIGNHLRNIVQIHPGIPVFEISARTEDGIKSWVIWLKEKVKEKLKP
jgi:hypothetical protein